MDLSIIIPSYNTKTLLERCLTSVFTSLKNSAISFEVIVVDNASTDGTNELLYTKFPRVKTILNRSNIGYGKANNIAIQKAQGHSILLLNSDIEVKNGAIERLYTFGKNHPRSFVGGKLLNEDGSPQPSCGPMYSLMVVAVMLFAKGDAFGITRYCPNTSREVDWVSGACLLGEKKVFDEVGYFDENIFLYMEEIDFLYRAKQIGYTVLFDPEARFLHTGAASSGDHRTPVVNIYRGLLYFYKKHRSKLALAILRSLLEAKALAAILIGRMIGKRDIVQRYEEALSIL
ncbi:glycosyltransferase family 2 protein [Candidatus Gottesmanbacteria bacterium]|nr:glycosyltransferase family 2 protein [Candidatus Gottesmanbacteria bacterium]